MTTLNKELSKRIMCIEQVGFYSCVIFTPHGKEQKAVSTMIKVFNDTEDQGWYGTKEELKETEDFYPFILIKLGVPSAI